MTGNISAGRGKKRVLRTCVACRAVKEQSAMARFVAQGGRLTADKDKKLGGRGFYICRTKECATIVLSNAHRVSKALRTSVILPEEVDIFAALGL